MVSKPWFFHVVGIKGFIHEGFRVQAKENLKIGISTSQWYHTWEIYEREVVVEGVGEDKGYSLW